MASEESLSWQPFKSFLVAHSEATGNRYSIHSDPEESVLFILGYDVDRVEGFSRQEDAKRWASEFDSASRRPEPGLE